MCVIEKRGKKPTPIISEEQVAQSPVNSAKIVIAKVESDEHIMVDNEVQFEIPPAEMALITNWTYKVRIGTSYTRTALHLTTSLGDIVAGPNLITENYLKLQWECRIKSLESPTSRTAAKR